MIKISSIVIIIYAFNLSSINFIFTHFHVSLPPIPTSLCFLPSPGSITNDTRLKSFDQSKTAYILWEKLEFLRKVISIPEFWRIMVRYWFWGWRLTFHENIFYSWVWAGLEQYFLNRTSLESWEIIPDFGLYIKTLGCAPKTQTLFIFSLWLEHNFTDRLDLSNPGNDIFTSYKPFFCQQYLWITFDYNYNSENHHLTHKNRAWVTNIFTYKNHIYVHRCLALIQALINLLFLCNSFKASHTWNCVNNHCAFLTLGVSVVLPGPSRWGRDGAKVRLCQLSKRPNSQYAQNLV